MFRGKRFFDECMHSTSCQMRTYGNRRTETEEQYHINSNVKAVYLILPSCLLC